MQKHGYVYILFNKPYGTLYTGVTSDLGRRMDAHKNGCGEGFSKKYETDKLGYYEMHETMEGAIWREKQIKAGNRKNKINLILSMNPSWKDLSEEIF